MELSPACLCPTPSPLSSAFYHILSLIFSQMKNNPNQLFWLLEKVPRPSDAHSNFSTFQQFLDNQQYTSRGILRYEKMFGAGYVSTGGPTTTKVRNL